MWKLVSSHYDIDIKNGIATPKVVRAFCKRYMKKEGNQLYGLYKDKEVGVCPNITPVPTSVNTMVIGNYEEYLKHYLMPNLIRNNSSAVVIVPDAERLYKKQKERLSSCGCKVLFIDLNTAGIFFDVKSLSTERTCIFVKASSASETADYLIQWLGELYNYAETSKMEGRDSAALPCNVHFYLGSPYYIQHKYFLNYLATCRKYNIGISYRTERIITLEKIFGEEINDVLYMDTMATLCLDIHPNSEDVLAYIKKCLTIRVTPDGKIPKYKAGVTPNFVLIEKCLLTDDEMQEIFNSVKSGKALFLWYNTPLMILDKLTERE